MKECVIETCTRDTEEGYCNQHNEANRNLEETFVSWKKAYGDNYSWEKYLKTIAETDCGAGSWVKDVAKLNLNSMN